MEIRPILSALLRSKTGAILVALQVAISLAILANALHIVNIRQAVSARPSGVLDESSLIYVELRHLRKSDHNAQMAQQKTEAAALRAVGGVSSVAFVNQMPMTNNGSTTSVAADRKQLNASAGASFYFSPDSLVKTLGLKLIEGRDFRPDEVIEVDNDKDDDASQRPRAVIVSRTLAAKVWPNDSHYVGKTLYFGTGTDAQASPVVGVIETLQSQGAQVEERGEYSSIVPMRLSNGYGTIYAIRVEAGQVDRVMKEAEAALLRTTAEPTDRQGQETDRHPQGEIPRRHRPVVDAGDGQRPAAAHYRQRHRRHFQPVGDAEKKTDRRTPCPGCAPHRHPALLPDGEFHDHQRRRGQRRAAGDRPESTAGGETGNGQAAARLPVDGRRACSGCWAHWQCTDRRGALPVFRRPRRPGALERPFLRRRVRCYANGHAHAHSPDHRR